MKMEYNEFFKKMLGFEPYAYQAQVADCFLRGKNIILSVPTGAGKTWASILPFLYSRHQGLVDFPQKMIYNLPLRTLTNSIYNDTNDLLSKEKIKNYFPDLMNLISIQTGEYKEDPYFEKDIIFSTIDQTLSNFLCFPLSLSNKQANINAGALIGSYLIFDEFHLLDSKLSMSTTLGMLKILKNLCRVCIMTATLTDDFISFLQSTLIDFEVVKMNEFTQDIPKIKSLIPADDKVLKKSIHLCNHILEAKYILEKHKNKTIVICNRVETAQRIFFDLKNAKDDSIKIISIHSRFFDCDRKDREALIKRYFGKNSVEKNVILIATQVIEAGMDISCDIMFTEISPVNSFLQRAGRCARFAKEYGDIYICDVLNLEEKNIITIDKADEKNTDEIKKINSKYLPYDKELCEQTLKELGKYDHIDESISTNLVNAVLTDSENFKSNNIETNIYNKDIIYESWIDCDKKHYKESIRDIQSIDIVLLDFEKFQNMRIKPYLYEKISVYRWSFIGWIKNIKKVSDDWIVASAELSNDSVFDYEWQSNSSCYLRRLDVSRLSNYYDVVFVDNKYFDYNEAGLVVSNNNNGYISPLKKNVENEDNKISYHKDTFYQHNKALLNCYDCEFKPKLSFLYNQLAKFYDAGIDWEQLIKLTICLHDFGKLNYAWQKPMLNYQQKKINDKSYFEILAHTDYDEDTDINLAKDCGINKKPSHAGIGALQAYDILYDIYDEKIAKIFSCVILKHHGVKTESSDSFQIKDEYLVEIKKLLEEIGIKGKLIKKERGESLSSLIPYKGKEKEWILYLLFVRILRLCDQKATKSKDKYYNL